jgi:hypothetical protein
MSTTHTWKGGGNPNSSGPFIFDKSQYTDGQPFEPGDTLVVNSGQATIASRNGSLIYLTTGNYVFNGAALDTQHIGLDPASTLSVNGPGQFQWVLEDQFVNDGTIQIGSSAGSANAYIALYNSTASSSNTVTLTNNGSITIQNNSPVLLQLAIDTPRMLINAAGASLNVKSGSSLNYSNFVSPLVGDTNSNTTNNGLITVSGAAGQKTNADLYGSVQGSGLLSVRGASGDKVTDTIAYISGTASGTFDIASGELDLSVPPASGAINFLDNDSVLYDDNNNGQYLSNSPYGATINGFQAGDQIDVVDSSFGAALNLSGYSLSWDASKNLDLPHFPCCRCKLMQHLGREHAGAGSRRDHTSIA